MNKSYQEFKKRQILEAIVGFMGMISWIFLALSSGGVLDDWLIPGIIVFGIIWILAVVQTRKPIFCEHCESELTEVYMKAEAVSKKIIACPYCAKPI